MLPARTEKVRSGGYSSLFACFCTWLFHINL